MAAFALMPTLTRISQQKRTPNRRNIHLDGRFAFTCHVNVVARFRLRAGMELTSEQVREIQRGELQQHCMDAALEFLGRRLHSRQELQRKLARAGYARDVISAALDELVRLDYVNDERFAKTRALSAAQHKQHGRRRAFADLVKSGVSATVAERALDDVYSQGDGLTVARELARKHAPRLGRLDPIVARRRLAGMLQRRGFDYETIKAILDEVLGGNGDELP